MRDIVLVFGTSNWQLGGIRRCSRRMKAAINLTSIGCLLPFACLAGEFGEGFSSMVPGGHSDISFRAFTIYTLQEACEKSAVPAELRVLPNPLVLKVGDRIHRSNASPSQGELIIEAYGEDGEFIPAVPVIVSTMDVQGVTAARSDWDYFEAIRTGEDDIVVAWPCTQPDEPWLEARARLLVVSDESD